MTQLMRLSLISTISTFTAAFQAAFLVTLLVALLPQKSHGMSYGELVQCRDDLVATYKPMLLNSTKNLAQQNLLFALDDYAAVSNFYSQLFNASVKTLNSLYVSYSGSLNPTDLYMNLVFLEQKLNEVRLAQSETAKLVNLWQNRCSEKSIQTMTQLLDPRKHFTESPVSFLPTANLNIYVNVTVAGDASGSSGGTQRDIPDPGSDSKRKGVSQSEEDALIVTAGLAAGTYFGSPSVGLFVGSTIVAIKNYLPGLEADFKMTDMKNEILLTQRNAIQDVQNNVPQILREVCPKVMADTLPETTISARLQELARQFGLLLNQYQELASKIEKTLAMKRENRIEDLVNSKNYFENILAKNYIENMNAYRINTKNLGQISEAFLESKAELLFVEPSSSFIEQTRQASTVWKTLLEGDELINPNRGYFEHEPTGEYWVDQWSTIANEISTDLCRKFSEVCE